MPVTDEQRVSATFPSTAPLASLGAPPAVTMTTIYNPELLGAFMEESLRKAGREVARWGGVGEKEGWGGRAGEEKGKQGIQVGSALRDDGRVRGLVTLESTARRKPECGR